MLAVLSGIVLLIFGITCMFASVKRHWAFALLFCFFGFEQLLGSSVGFFSSNASLINFMVAGLSASSVAVALFSGKRPLAGGLNATSMLVFALYVFSFMGSFYSPIPEAGPYFFRLGIPYIILMLVILPSMVATTEQISKMAIPFMLVGCSIVGIITIHPNTSFSGSRMYIDMSATKGFGAVGNPLAIAEIGGYLVIVGSLMRPRVPSFSVRVLRIASILLGISIAFLSSSRGQLFASVIVSVMFFPVAYEIKNVKQFFIRAGSVGVAGILVMAIAKMFLLGSASTERFNAENISQGLSSRMYYATTMLQEYASQPSSYLQGLGIGSFNVYIAAGEDGYLYPHNLIIEIIADHGLIGFGIFLAVVISTGTHTFKLLRLIRVQAIDRNAIAIVLAMAGYTTLLSMKQGSYLLIPAPFFMYLIISKIYVRHKIDMGDTGEFYEEQDSTYDDYADEDFVHSESA